MGALFIGALSRITHKLVITKLVSGKDNNECNVRMRCVNNLRVMSQSLIRYQEECLVRSGYSSLMLALEIQMSRRLFLASASASGLMAKCI